jgi:putative peptide zinc metalloprotease protein
MSALAPAAPMVDETTSPLPGMREDLHVQRVGAYRDGSPRFRIHDPLRNRYFELGLIEVELLAQWRAGATAVELAQGVSQQLDTDVDPHEVLVLRNFLMQHQLTDGSGGAGYLMLRDMFRRQGKQHWLIWLLHTYLFFRIPLVRPDAWLVRMLPYARALVSWPCRIALLVILLLTPVMVAREWTEYTASFAGLFTFNGLLASAVAAFIAKILHEFGHAFVARAHGVRVPVMGLAFLVMWPVLYTDTSDSWKLADHKARFRIAAAGIATELAIALVCLLLWTVTPPGGLRTALFFLSTTSLLLTLSINASPFMRFDGYFLLSDAMDFPNLHERSGAMARWWMRRTLWGLDLPPPEVHSRRMAIFLIAFAYVTWAYRAVVFAGIAVLVYFAFFKLLGILLMAVEVAWFLAQPVWKEASAIWKLRASLRPRWLRVFALAALVLGGLTLLAWSGESRAPALLMSREETRLYAPAPARVAAVPVRPGQVVEPGQLLLQLESPDLVFRARGNAVRIERVQGELARIPASDRQRESALVMQEELAQAMSERDAIQSELGLLTLRAAHGGRLVDVPSDLAPGRWVSPRQLLGRLVDPRQSQVRAWVSESQVRRLAVGDEVSFVPRQPELAILQGKVVRIDPTGTRVLPHQLLDGRHGGDLAATQDAKGEWMLRETLYQVDVQGLDVPATRMVQGGRLVVPTGPWSAITASTRQLLNVLVRESGF